MVNCWSRALKRGLLFTLVLGGIFVAIIAILMSLGASRLVATIGAKAVLLGGLCAFLIRYGRRVDFGLRKPRRWRNVIYAAPLFIFVCGVNLYPLDQHSLTVDADLLNHVLAACWEEIAFRGILIGLLLSFGIGPAAWASSVAFGSIHILNVLGDWSTSVALSWFYLSASAGLCLAAIRIDSRSLWPPLLFHLLVNVSAAITSAGSPGGLPAPEVPLVSLLSGTIFLGVGIGMLRASQRARRLANRGS
jgi:membrane protease YdiL (CAAX protease family)